MFDYHRSSRFNSLEFEISTTSGFKEIREYLLETSVQFLMGKETEKVY